MEAKNQQDLTVRPEEPGAGECCGSDCRDCVYIEYWCVFWLGEFVRVKGLMGLGGACV